MQRIKTVLSCLFAVIAMTGQMSEAAAQIVQAPPPPVIVPPAPPPPIALPPAPSAPPALRDGGPFDLSQANLYVYDFLDIREKVFQPKVLDEIERQLIAWLTPRTKSVTIVRSQQTPFVLKRDANNWQAEISPEHEVERVPVVESIASNGEKEQQFGADHQLIVFPAAFTISGVWRYYTIRFVLVRKSDQKTWQHFYEGSHMVMLSEGERSKSRADKIISNLDAAMAANGLVPASAEKKGEGKGPGRKRG